MQRMGWTEGSVQGDDREKGAPYLVRHVARGEHKSTLRECLWYRDRHEQAREHHGDQKSPHRRPFGVEPVGEPGCVYPGPPHSEQQEERLQRADQGQVFEQPVGELRHGEDEDQVEEQLQSRDLLPAHFPGSQQVRGFVPLLRLLPVSAAAEPTTLVRDHATSFPRLSPEPGRFQDLFPLGLRGTHPRSGGFV
jgi:hypothetical protein